MTAAVVVAEYLPPVLGQQQLVGLDAWRQGQPQHAMVVQALVIVRHLTLEEATSLAAVGVFERLTSMTGKRVGRCGGPHREARKMLWRPLWMCRDITNTSPVNCLALQQT